MQLEKSNLGADRSVRPQQKGITVMTLYNVHIYREMRLTFEGIQAGPPDAAGRRVRRKIAPRRASTSRGLNGLGK